MRLMFDLLTRVILQLEFVSALKYQLLEEIQPTIQH